MSNYLLDVNVVVAHAILEHVHHLPVTAWLEKNKSAGAGFHVSPIIELGLIRKVMRIGSLSIAEAKQLLLNEIDNLELRRISDSISASYLPDWIQGYRQTTDAYLCQLAKAHDLLFVTIDKGVPDALKILG